MIKREHAANSTCRCAHQRRPKPTRAVARDVSLDNFSARCASYSKQQTLVDSFRGKPGRCNTRRYRPRLKSAARRDAQRERHLAGISGTAAAPANDKDVPMPQRWRDASHLVFPQRPTSQHRKPTIRLLFGLPPAWRTRRTNRNPATPSVEVGDVDPRRHKLSKILGFQLLHNQHVA
jgi:hypothetical protein